MKRKTKKEKAAKAVFLCAETCATQMYAKHTSQALSIGRGWPEGSGDGTRMRKCREATPP